MRNGVARGMRAFLSYLLPVIVTLAVLGLCLEGGARLLLPGNTVIWPALNDLKVGMIFAPNATVRYSNGLDFDVTETSNEAGFLDRKLPAPAKPPGTCRVALIGDSFVEAAQVKTEHKVQVLFERLAQQHWPGLAVETMAFGHSGTGQLNQLGYYDHVAQPRKPDAVVLVVFKNDLADNSSLLSGLRNGFHPHHAPMPFGREAADGTIELQPIDPGWLAHMLPSPVDRRSRWHRVLHDYSRFYQWLFVKLSLLYPEAMRGLGWLPDEGRLHADRMRHLMAADPRFAKALGEVDRPDLPDVHAMTRELYRMFASGAAIPAIYAQAVRFTSFGFEAFKRRAWRDGFELVALSAVGTGEELDAGLKSLVEAKGIPYLSQEAYIRGLGEPLAKAHFPHDGHWNRQGHIWAAEQLLDHFARTGLCGRPRKPLR